MSTMKNFYKLLNASSEPRDSYMNALAELTKVNRAQLSVLASDLEWQEWGTQLAEPVTA